MNRLATIAALLLMAASWSAPAWAQAQMLQQKQQEINQKAPASIPGAAIWAERCAQCHDNAVDRIPPRLHLQAFRTPEQVVTALTRGTMVPQAKGLSADQIKQVATYLIGTAPTDTVAFDPTANRCRHAAPPMKPRPADWASWGVDSGNARYQQDPGFSAADIARLKVKWVFGYPGDTVDGQPTITSGRLFVSSRFGWVFSLDAKTGCTYWSFEPEGGVRTAVVIGALPAGARAAKGAKFAAYFTTESGFLHAVDAETGKLLWKTRVGDHLVIRISGSPLLYNGRLYQGISTQEELATRDPKYVCCTSRGTLVALDAVTGKIIWKGYTIDEPKPIGTSTSGTPQFGPAGGTIWTTPTVDAKRNMIYANTGNSFSQVSTDGANAVVAFDLTTGARRWVMQALADDNWCGDKKELCPKTGPDMDMNGSPILTALGNGKQILLAGVKTGEAFGLDPDQDGKVIWHQKPMPRGNGWGYSAGDNNFYVNGRGGLAALDAATGEQRWLIPPPKEPVCSWQPAQITGVSAMFVAANKCTSSQMAATAAMPGAVFSGSTDGHIRAYRATDGAIVWDFDTGRTWEGVNGVKATGGSFNYTPVAIADGALYVTSGSGGHDQPGNALIVFSVDGK